MLCGASKGPDKMFADLKLGAQTGNPCPVSHSTRKGCSLPDELSDTTEGCAETALMCGHYMGDSALFSDGI